MAAPAPGPPPRRHRRSAPPTGPPHRPYRDRPASAPPGHNHAPSGGARPAPRRPAPPRPLSSRPHLRVAKSRSWSVTPRPGNSPPLGPRTPRPRTATPHGCPALSTPPRHGSLRPPRPGTPPPQGRPGGAASLAWPHIPHPETPKQHPHMASMPPSPPFQGAQRSPPKRQVPLTPWPRKSAFPWISPISPPGERRGDLGGSPSVAAALSPELFGVQTRLGVTPNHQHSAFFSR